MHVAWPTNNPLGLWEQAVPSESETLHIITIHTCVPRYSVSNGNVASQDIILDYSSPFFMWLALCERISWEVIRSHVCATILAVKKS